MAAIVLTLPVFNSKNIPVLFKAGLAFSISFLLFPLLKLQISPFPYTMIPFIIGVIREIMLGLIIGFSVRLLLTGILLAGQLAGYQMGLAIANVMDPLASTQIPLLAQFMNLLAMLLFLVFNAHHFFVRAIVESFYLVPPLALRFNMTTMDQMMHMAAQMFVIAIKVGAPVVGVLIFTSVAFGLIARTVPQMNIFLVAMPVKIVIGLIFLGISFPYLSGFLRDVFYHYHGHLMLMIKGLMP